MDEKEEFTVRDRRSSTSEPAADAGQPKERPAAAEASAKKAGPDTSAPSDPGSAPNLDFPAFVISLATSAQISLGAIPHPETNQQAQNFPAAKQMIDILAMLKDKTRGNLSKDEEALLDQVLFTLRMHYVRTVEGQKKSGGS